MIFQIMTYAREFFRSIRAREDKGQGLIEYALIVLLISIVVILVLQALGVQVTAVFQNITDVLGGAGAGEGE